MTSAHTPAHVEAAVPVLVWTLGADAYALPVRAVRQVLRVPPLGHLPCAMRGLEGMATIQGRVIPALNMRQRFGLDPAPPAPHARLLVVRVPSALIGLLVDVVEGIRRLPTHAPPLSPVGGVERPWLAGAIADGQRIILVLKTSALMSPDEDRQLAAMRTQVGGAGVV